MNPDFAKELGVDPDFDSRSKVLVVVGRNASGKSFIRRWIQFSLRGKTEVVALSHEFRSGSGFQRAIVYGDESYQSTGAISAQTFVSGLSTMRSRKSKHIVIWDEPEIGMSEDLQAGSAEWLFSRLENDWPEHLLGIVLMTHSRLWVDRAMRSAGSRFLSLDGHGTAEEWLRRKIEPVDPEEMVRMSTEKFRRLNALMGKNTERG